MTDQNQNQNDLNEFDGMAAEQPAVAPAAAGIADIADALGVKIDEAPAKTDLKDLEISFNFEKIELIKKLVQETQNNLRRISCLLGEEMPEMAEKIKHNFLESRTVLSERTVLPEVFGESLNESKNLEPKTMAQPDVAYGESGERILEGVFNGQNMIGADGKEYAVPPNYSSKSKLVEGDILKLTIDARGNFLFKQIGPIERARVVGALAESETGGYCVAAGEKRWKVLTAPVTYFKGEPGDEAVILIPKDAPSKWAAVENVIKKSGE